MRFRVDDTRSGGGRKALSRDEVGPGEQRALFLGRLWALFGRGQAIDDGFEYHLVDDVSGVHFTAYSGASGPSYGAALSVSPAELAPVARALEAVLAATAPADCTLEISLDIDYGGGKMRIGVRDGEPFEKAKRAPGRGPKSAKTYEDCVAIAKARGGHYGIEVGWHLCIEQVMPELPDELEIDGRAYENCIAVGVDPKKGVIYAFDEGGGIEEISAAKIPWPKPLPAVARLWSASYERWVGEKKRGKKK
jgi:hypothetical protein